jgi:branched-chain amino acid aminotransferase
MPVMDIQIGLPPRGPDSGGVTIDLDPAKLEFGRNFCPHWFVAEYRGGSWQDLRVEPLHNISLHPAAIVLHYSQSIFEGLKAYRWADGRTALFRPRDNAMRFVRSAKRMAMPPVDPEIFLEGLKALVRQDSAWIPREPGSLYLRPTMIATEPCIGVRTSHEFLFYVLALPSGAYFKETGPSGTGTVAVYVAETTTRAAKGGTGNVKASANYAISLKTIEEGKKQGCSQVLFLDSNGKRQVEELGGMNVFFVEKDVLYTPPQHETVLPGITSNSVIRLAKDLGYEVHEAAIQMDEAAEKIRRGVITEVFACGTAAVVSGIREFLFESGRHVPIGDGRPGEVTHRLNVEITGIQFGRVEDKHGWVEMV